MKRFSLLMIMFLFLGSCATVPVGDTSQNALDWPGTYKCDKMTITLRENNTYRAQVGNVEIRSSFHWDRKRQKIVLENIKGRSSNKKFLVGENILIPLKNSGRPKKNAQNLIKISE